MLSQQTNLSHQICNVAKKMCRFIQTTRNHSNLWLNQYKLSFQNFHTLHVVIFTVEIKLSGIVIGILLNYFAKLLFRKY